jgi:hypothetical protein
MTFLDRLEALTEFAMRLSVAKNFLKEVKSDPMVKPFLVNGKINRASQSAFGIPGRPKKNELGPGIHIVRSQDPLYDLAHEYGHAQDSSSLIHARKQKQKISAAMTSARKDIEDAASNYQYSRIPDIIKKHGVNPKKAYDSDGDLSLGRIYKQIDRITYSRRLTGERVATRNGAEALQRAGANNGELGEYFRSIREGELPKHPSFALMHPTYEAAYESKKIEDPKLRMGGDKPMRRKYILPG